MSYASLWHSRPERERKAIAIGAAAIGVLLVFAIVWLPLERLRNRLSAELPHLRASVAQLKRDAVEVKRLREIPPTATPGSASLSALASQPLPRELNGAQVIVTDAKHVRFAAADAGFTALLDWLLAAQSAQGLRVESARIDALPAPGRVRAELTLAKS